MKCCENCKHANYSDSTGSACISALSCVSNDYCDFEKEDEDILIKRNIKNNSQKKEEKKDNIKTVIFIGGTILFFLFIIWTSIGSLVYRFNNPTLTATQLIIWSWKQYAFQNIYIIIWSGYFYYIKSKF